MNQKQSQSQRLSLLGGNHVNQVLKETLNSPYRIMDSLLFLIKISKKIFLHFTVYGNGSYHLHNHDTCTIFDEC